MPGTNDAQTSRRLRSREHFSRGDDQIVIGLVNNMPDAALQTTERQFRELIAAAGQNLAVSLRFFFLPEMPRAEAGWLYVSQSYENISALWTSELDGLIVTGTVPRAAALPDEPYWQSLAQLVEWAEDHTSSTVWSCLAAHAAVLQIDGIGRCVLSEKLSGVFDCVKTADHAILAGTPSRWQIPHSRYNGLPEEELVARGYCILSRSPEAGADIFIKQRKSLSIFVQGHPEYDPEALFREYRRDVARFLSAESESYPEMPRGYFDEAMTAALTAFREQASRNRDVELLSTFPTTHPERRLVHTWREPAVRIYANWLSHLAAVRSHQPPAEVDNPARAYREPNRP